MALPPNTSRLLYSGGTWKLPGDDDIACVGAKFHSPTPLFTDSVRLVPRSWVTHPGFFALAEHAVPLCGTCRDNLAILQQIFKARDGDVPWEVRREFGNEIRALAVRGWKLFAEAAEGVALPSGA